MLRQAISIDKLYTPKQLNKHIKTEVYGHPHILKTGRFSPYFVVGCKRVFKRKVKITVQLPQKEPHIVEAPLGKRLREVLLDANLTPYRGRFQTMNCHGLGICGSCTVEVLESGEWWERRSCQIQCFSDMEIQLK